MAHLEAATKAPLGSILPSLLFAKYLERKESLPPGWLPLSKTYTRAARLQNGALVQLTLPGAEGKTWSDRDVAEQLMLSAKKPSSPQRPADEEEWVRRSYELAIRNPQDLNRSLLELESHLTLAPTSCDTTCHPPTLLCGQRAEFWCSEDRIIQINSLCS